MEESGDNYMITFYKIPGEMSDIDRTETIYYISGTDPDLSWSDQFSDADLVSEGWKTERVYYKVHNGKASVSDREVIETWEGDDAKAIFVDPDFSPFDPAEVGDDAVYTINIGTLYGAGDHEDLNYYFGDFWEDIEDGSELVGQYSSFTRSLSYEDDSMIDSPNQAYAEQNDYYTEVNNIQDFPEVLGMDSDARGNVRAGISYRMTALPDSEPLEIVNVNGKYYDEENNFLMKDVKSFEHAEESSFPYVYHHKAFYTEDIKKNDKFKFKDIIYYYASDDVVVVRTEGIDSFDKKVEQDLKYDKNGWSGTFKLNTAEGVPVEFYVDFFGDYLSYKGEFNGMKFELKPKPNGDINVKLPGGGTLIGHISDEGELEITNYTPKK